MKKPWDHQGKSSHARGYGRDYQLRRKALLTAEPLCRPCRKAGRVALATMCDHITPLAKGGTHDLANLQPICGPCHDQKTQAEAAEAQGRTYRPRRTIAADGWPVE